MTRFERLGRMVGALVLLLAANRVVQWLQTGDVFPKPEPMIYEGSLGEPEDWKFLTKPRTPALDPTYLRLLEQSRRYEEIDFSKLDSSLSGGLSPSLPSQGTSSGSPSLPQGAR